MPKRKNTTYYIEKKGNLPATTKDKTTQSKNCNFFNLMRHIVCMLRFNGHRIMQFDGMSFWNGTKEFFLFFSSKRKKRAARTNNNITTMNWMKIAFYADFSQSKNWNRHILWYERKTAGIMTVKWINDNRIKLNN